MQEDSSAERVCLRSLGSMLTFYPEPTWNTHVTLVRYLVTVTPGTVLANKYRVERILGRGGMGLVVEATNLNLGRRVALKFLHSEALENPVAVERFWREARAAARIDHPHVARVMDVESLETGGPCMVMEYLEGVDLEVWLRQKGRLSIEQAATFMLQVCDAIAEAHRVGIVHRDIKPANLFVTHTGAGLPFIKVLDFGISKVANDAVGSVTKTTAFLGSPLYMSPEQMKSSKGVDERSDIWSLGAVLFELLTGEVPFRADTIPELTLKIALSPTPLLTALRADASVLLEGVVHRCLEKEREARYGSVSELMRALQPFADQVKPSESGYPALATDSGGRGDLPSNANTRTADLPDRPHSAERKPNATESSWSRPDTAKAAPSRRWPLLLAALLTSTAALAWFVGHQGQPLVATTVSSVSPTGTDVEKEPPERGATVETFFKGSPKAPVSPEAASAPVITGLPPSTTGAPTVINVPSVGIAVKRPPLALPTPKPPPAASKSNPQPEPASTPDANDDRLPAAASRSANPLENLKLK